MSRLLSKKKGSSRKCLEGQMIIEEKNQFKQLIDKNNLDTDDDKK